MTAEEDKCEAQSLLQSRLFFVLFLLSPPYLLASIITLKWPKNAFVETLADLGSNIYQQCHFWQVSVCYLSLRFLVTILLVPQGGEL